MLGALRARRAQTLTVLVLALLAGDVATAPAIDRIFEATRDQDLDRAAADELSTFRAVVDRAFTVPGATGYLNMSETGRYQRGEVSLGVPLDYRERVCDHLALTGRCPTGANEGLVVTGQSRVGQARSRLDGQGPAMALWFYLLTAGLGVLLAAAAAWVVAGVDIPMFATQTVPWPAPSWPRPGVVLWTWAVAVAMLVGVALVAAYDLSRRIRRFGRFERFERPEITGR
ncbi:hypothetical protein GCM10023322_19020 [Rugosimonospora acidiphila]|uniref:Uncharacterized protein n=1 Tax=Rugosimonospora acidiphila TaxID=556531 RepID=A0ABP9RP48_9ACTN